MRTVARLLCCDIEDHIRFVFLFNLEHRAEMTENSYRCRALHQLLRMLLLSSVRLSYRYLSFAVDYVRKIMRNVRKWATETWTRYLRTRVLSVRCA